MWAPFFQGMRVFVFQMEQGNQINVTRQEGVRRPCPKETRKIVIRLWQLGGFNALDTAHCNALRANHEFPHMDTCKR